MNKQKYLQSINQRISNVSNISSKMKDYQNGYEASEIETRSAYEKMNDKNYIFQELRDKVIELFNNDAEMSQEFMELLAGSSVTPQDFELAYNQLMTNFSGKLAKPDDVMTNLRKLVDNFKESGVSSQPGHNQSALVSYDPQDVKQMIQDAMQTVQTGYDNELISTNVAQDNMDKLEAFNVLMQRLQSLMSQPFAQDYDKDQKEGLMKYARNQQALKDIVEILSSGNADETNSTHNLELLIEKLEKVKESTFKQWARNTNVDMKNELISNVKEAKKASKKDTYDQELDEELNQLSDAHKEGLIEDNPDDFDDHVLGPKCKDCGHKYVRNWKSQHNKTDRHLKDR